MWLCAQAVPKAGSQGGGEVHEDRCGVARADRGGAAPEAPSELEGASALDGTAEAFGRALRLSERDQLFGIVSIWTKWV